MSSSTSSNRATARRRRNSASTSSGGGTSCNTNSVGSVVGKRTFVKHNYTDHLFDPYYQPTQNPGEEDENGVKRRRGPRGGVVTPFPERLHNMLSAASEENFEDIVSWQPHGRCFVVHDPKRFVEEVMPKYFKQSKLTSFQRQVNLYGFRRLTNSGPDRGGYYHELFLRSRPDLHKRLMRIRIKGNGTKSAASPASEPDFYKMAPCVDCVRKAAGVVGNVPASFGQQQEKSEPPVAVASSAFKPLERPSLANASPLEKPLEAPTLAVFDHHNTNKSSSGDAEHTTTEVIMDPWGLRLETPPPFSSQLTLTSMAREIVRGSQHVPCCPVTPESYSSQLYSMPMVEESSNNDEGMMMTVSPSQSAVSSPCTTPTVSPLDMDFSEDLPPLSAPALMTSAVDRMDAFQQEIQALIQDVEIDFDDGIPALDGKMDDSLDPLLLLDEVSHSSSHCCY